MHPAPVPILVTGVFSSICSHNADDLVLDPFERQLHGWVAETRSLRWMSIDIEPAYVRASAVKFGLGSACLVSLSSDIVDLLRRSFADMARWPRWPKPLHLIQGALLVESGTDISDAAKIVGTTVMRLMEVATGHDPVEIVLRVTEADLKAEAIAKLRRNVGQLVLARAAEIAFQEIFEAGIDQREFSMKDVPGEPNQHRFRLLNGGGRPLYRFNVKYLRRSSWQRRVHQNLPSDCFPACNLQDLGRLAGARKGTFTLRLCSGWRP